MSKVTMEGNQSKTKQGGSSKPSGIGSGVFNRPNTAKTNSSSAANSAQIDQDAYGGGNVGFSRCK